MDKETQIKTIKTDGYYYHEYQRDSQRTKYSGKGIKMKILLKKGYFHNFSNGYGNLCSNNIDIDCEFKMSEKLLDDDLNRKNIKDPSKRSIWNWGKFEIEKDSIRIQWFYNKFGDYYLIEEKGLIIDSLTFKILKVKDYGSKKEYSVDEVYHYKKYDVDKMYEKTPDFSKIL